MPKRLLSLITFGNDLEKLNYDWNNANQLLEEFNLNGFEIYPVAGYDLDLIPKSIFQGLHLQFFVLLQAIWRGSMSDLLSVFGTEENIRHFYGSIDRQVIVNKYQQQMEIASQFEVDYTVFHAGQSDMEGIYTWQFPWDVWESLDICSEIVNETTRGKNFTTPIYFENLWWPGSLQMRSQAEIEYLLNKVDYPDVGLVLDTGHLINTNLTIESEEEAIDYVIKSIKELGDMRRMIKVVHLNLSLSASKIKASIKQGVPTSDGDFWSRLNEGHYHVHQIDQHLPFQSTKIAKLFELIEPEFVVYEFSNTNLSEWKQQIESQNHSLSALKSI